MKTNRAKKQNIHLIGVSPKYRDQVFQHASEAINTGAKVLKYTKPLDVVIFDAESWDIPEKLSLVAHARVYYIDCKMCFYRKDINVKKAIATDLSPTLQHEFSHVVRANTVGYPETLLDSLIDEGIACFVEKASAPDRTIPYIQEQKDEKKSWTTAKKDLSKRLTSDLHNAWFFGTGEKPNWIGYRLGFLIVQEYMKNNKTNLAKLVRTSSKEILKGSNFAV